MSIKRWFDLANHGARLDRRVSDSGSPHLVMKFKDAEAMAAVLRADNVDAVAQVGWVKAEGELEIQHFGDFRDFTEIARSLAVVFDDDTVSSSIVAREDLKQGEVLEGVDRPIYVGKEHIDHSMKHLPDAIRTRALEMIEKARERQLAFKGASVGATGGKIWELSDKVSEHVGAGFSTVLSQIATMRHDNDVIARISELVGKPTDSAKNEIENILKSVDLDEIGLREYRKTALALGYSRDAVEVIAASEYIQRLSDARDLVLDLDTPQAKPAPISEGYARDVHGFRFEVSADTTTLAAREYQARLTKAVDFIANTFGMEPSDVFPPNTRIRVVQGMANILERGHQVSITRRGKDQSGEDFVDQSNAIVFSQNTLGTALHEMAHALSRRLGDDPAKYDEVIHGSGLMEAMDGNLSEGRMRGVLDLFDEDYTAYLRDPEEVFARMVENALRMRCLDLHGNLDPLGGHAISGHHQNYAPLTPEIMERTIQVVKNYGASRGVMSELSVNVPEAMPEQRQAAGRLTMRGR